MPNDVFHHDRRVAMVAAAMATVTLLNNFNHDSSDRWGFRLTNAYTHLTTRTYGTFERCVRVSYAWSGGCIPTILSNGVKSSFL